MRSNSLNTFRLIAAFVGVLRYFHPNFIEK